MVQRAIPLPPEGIREASVREAMAIIEREGLASLSLRDVARRLGVSHQAPYKYFPTRDHLLAEIVGRCFDEFGDALEAAVASEPDLDLALMAMGASYLNYAATRPSHYGLMFTSPLPDKSVHLDMAEKASRAFHVLRRAVLALHLYHGQPEPERRADQDALHLWATMHGLATLLQHDSIKVLELDQALLQAAPLHAFMSIAAAMIPGGCEDSTL